MKKYIFTILTVCFTLQLCAKDAVMQRYDALSASADSMQMNNDNPMEIAAAYAKVVELCRQNAELADRLPINLYQYGMFLSYAGDYQISIDLMTEVLDMSGGPENESLYTVKARANMHLGVICFFQQRWDDALVYYTRARDMAVELDNPQGISIAENNIGNIYQKKENYDMAVQHYLRCLEMQDELGDKETICNTYYNLGTCYYLLDELRVGFDYLQRALDMAEEIGDVEITALSLSKLSILNAKEKRKFDVAVRQIDRAEKLAVAAGLRQVQTEIYDIRCLVEEERGDYRTALIYFKRLKGLADTLLSESSMNKLREYEVRYDTQGKELEIIRQQAEIERHETRGWMLGGGLVAAGLMLVLLGYAVVQRNRRNRVLAEANATKDRFFSIISHDLKNPVIAQRDALQMLASHSGRWDADSLATYYRELLKSADGQIELLYNLLNWAKVQTGRMPYRPVPFDLAAALRPDIDLVRSMAARKGVDFETAMPETVLVTGDSSMIATVVRNLLTNAVKFTPAGGNVSLRVEKTDRGWRVAVRDTGVGMSAEQIADMFRIDIRNSQTGTAGEHGSGLGLIVCRELLEKHGTRLEIDSRRGLGSEFGFVLYE